MKNLRNALLLKQLYQLKELGYRYTTVTPYREQEPDLSLPHTLEALKAQALGCHLCELSKGRSHVVFGEGSPQATVLFVGEAPGVSEDSIGRVFVGRSGELLTKMIEGVLKIPRSQAYLTTLVKCRPLQESRPNSTQIHSCLAYLHKEIELIAPKVVVTLGETPYRYLTGEEGSLDQVHGVLHTHESYQIIPTYHPSYLLRNPALKPAVFEDLKRVKALLG